MLKYIKEYRFYFALLAFLLVPVFAIDTSTRSPLDFRHWDRALLWESSPIHPATRWTLDLGVDAVQSYLYLWHTRQDNVTLLEENRKLLNTIAGLRETQQENVRLRSLLAFREKYDLETVIARVIAKDVSTEFRAIRVNRGESAGVRKDMAVLTTEGIVGRVLRTTRTTADIVTVLDLLSAVDAIVERSRARGIVEGMTEEVCNLRFVLRTDDIQPGDVLVSSGLGGIFP